MKSKKNNSTANLNLDYQIYDANQFGLKRDEFDAHALETVRVLQNAGFEAFIVGGGVRDQLLNLHPKDFDVATSAKPEEVKPLFPKCLVIGKRFRLAHVYFGRREIVEVATFRRDHSLALNENDAKMHASGLISRDNVYGTLDEDAMRRDFTINAVYYNPKNHTLLDFSGGITDFSQKKLRLIGDPDKRFPEDPVRILRAIRISNKIGFQIESTALEAIPRYIPYLEHVSPARLFDEYQKLLLYGEGVKNFHSLESFHILPIFFAHIEASLSAESTRRFITLALENTDTRYAQGKTIHPAFLLAVFLWQAVLTRAEALRQEGMSMSIAMQEASREILSEQLQRLSIPRFFVQMIRDVWSMQRWLEARRKNKIMKTLHHPKFRAAYDFLLLRGAIGEVSPALCDWWLSIQQASSEEQGKMINALGKKARS